jgi:hypothetical protein
MSSKTDQIEVRSFNEWLAGLIDGHGCFQLSKKGYDSLEIVMEIRDKHCLYLIKQKFGGAVKVRSGLNHLRYRLHHKSGLLLLINSVNGLIRNPVRMLQLGKICDKYELELIYPEPLTYNNGWLSGFFDSDGSIYMNSLSGQLFITASQNNKFLLDSLVTLYGGSIVVERGRGSYESFLWYVTKRETILNLIEYFKKYPSRSHKKSRLHLIPKFLELIDLKAHKSQKKSILNKIWVIFYAKWLKTG